MNIATFGSQKFNPSILCCQHYIYVWNLIFINFSRIRASVPLMLQQDSNTRPLLRLVLTKFICQNLGIICKTLIAEIETKTETFSLETEKRQRRDLSETISLVSSHTYFRSETLNQTYERLESKISNDRTTSCHTWFLHWRLQDFQLPAQPAETNFLCQKFWIKTADN